MAMGRSPTWLRSVAGPRNHGVVVGSQAPRQQDRVASFDVVATAEPRVAAGACG